MTGRPVEGRQPLFVFNMHDRAAEEVRKQNKLVEDYVREHGGSLEDEESHSEALKAYYKLWGTILVWMRNVCGS
ncbi:hypothetical protein GRF59_08370 [Paenibacillus sp. HJL G12]|uniref:Uncharacterized protein n=1 Tax=Paenibacillus dendrobii TaxID=2691084 RepID=A0A7X3IGR5_9BACL|nr:hypothetical protein [Paenibacillus dendrobii]MWV43649.1 hypothetical protein [Paenibacillus dendrobii]